MRYQLRYIRTQRTRSSPAAKHDDSPVSRDRTNLLVPLCVFVCGPSQRFLPLPWLVLTFDLVRLSAPVS